ncbi:hypothetical protein DDE82_000936 [Stemphylium lycopersici]|uniref:Uncharacterized protein n=1 Tax=Stemphylium lycopersici TaxID=183478 RepID=A0A364NEL0_STELY|nr:hypothetical protein TW65_05837 [Stemphylium lycopersici]RAR10964.1 hypothetical protein DDE82_000936 [Stemphylium lycopersici]RAR15706.1 hypothetical protein DDE83_000938 [Stemphylium lycopersici]
MAKGKIVEKKEEEEEKKKKKKPLAKTTKPTAAKRDAPEQPTPVTPVTSRILDQVRAKGTLSQTQGVKADGSSSTSGVSAAATEKTTPPAPPPEPQMKPRPPPPTTQRTTTIPLPRKPAPAPSPIHPLSHTAVRSSSATAPRQQQAAKNPYPSTLRPSQQQHQQQRPHPPAYQNTRIIEPTPDIRLPPKYKPAARRVTAIIVGLPIVIVFGWELWARWRGKEVKRKFGEGV